jgi:hypothetical protein
LRLAPRSITENASGKQRLVPEIASIPRQATIIDHDGCVEIAGRLDRV